MLMFNSTLPREVQLAAYQNRIMAGLDKKMKTMQNQKGTKKRANTFAKALMAGAESYLKQN